MTQKQPPPIQPAEPPYPISLSVDFPDRPLNRLSSFLRIFFVVPVFIVLALLGFGPLFLPVLFLLLFRYKYPRWWFDWQLALTRFSARILAYLSLLRDEYPSTDAEQAVHLDITYPDARRDLNRWLPLVKWLLALPHYVVLFFLTIAALVSVVFAWFAILFTGHYPKSLFDFVVGVQRWWFRVDGYAFLLVTDRYPPFRLTP